MRAIFTYTMELSILSAGDGDDDCTERDEEAPISFEDTTRTSRLSLLCKAGAAGTGEVLLLSDTLSNPGSSLTCDDSSGDSSSGGGVTLTGDLDTGGGVLDKAIATSSSS
jgi:hypothetical protein